MRSAKYRAFISYRHTPADRAWALWLHSALEQYRLPRRLISRGFPQRLGTVFRDEEELPASSDLSTKITEALQGSEYLIVVCSPLTPGSRWVNEEVSRFQALGRAEQILALLVDGEPTTSFPPALRDREPLAADVRPLPERSRRAALRSALLKLVAGMLGVDYDELRQRDEERARTRMLWVSSASLAAAVVLLGLTVFAGTQWARAERELRTANAQRLAGAAQNALAETPYAAEIGTVHPSRGALLALESLTTEALPEGDAALRRALWRLAEPPLEIPIADGESLASIAVAGRSLQAVQTSGGGGSQTIRQYDVASGEWAEGDEVPAHASTSRADPYDSDLTSLGSDGVLTQTSDGAVQLMEDDQPPDPASWVFAGYRLVRAADQRTFWRLPHDWQLRLATFSLDGAYLLTVTGEVSKDASDAAATRLPGSMVRIFDLAQRRLVTEVSLAQEGISAVALSPDRTWLATQSPATDSHLVRLWPLWPAMLRAEVCRRLTRNLSPSEWSTFLGPTSYRETCPGLPIESE